MGGGAAAPSDGASSQGALRQRASFRHGQNPDEAGNVPCFRRITECGWLSCEVSVFFGAVFA